jgi:hypothetical protein
MGGRLRSGNGYQSLESAQDLIVGSIVWDLVRLRRSSDHATNVSNHLLAYRVDVSNDSSDSRQPGPSTRNDANVLVGVLANLSAPVFVIIEACDGLAKCWDSEIKCVVERKVRMPNSEGHRPFTPVVGAYSKLSTGIGTEVGRSGASGIGPTSGAPCPRFDHACESA